MKKISLETIDNSTEKKIILLLQEKEKCMMGDIFKDLKLSYKEGKQYLRSLQQKNWISNSESTPYYTLKIELI